VTRPVAAGYLAMKGPLADSEAEVRAMRQRMADLARSEGYAIGPLFTDIRSRDESGLYGLVEYLRREDVVAVVVPDVSHLTPEARLHEPRTALDGGPEF
jgi:hypothetical protein